MKTKHILTAMVLPAMFAACTAEEIVDNNNVVAQGRAEVEAVSFAIDGVGSRLAYNDGLLAWDWESTDKFLLLNADNGDAPVTADGTLPGNRFTAGKPTTGYEYAKGEDGLYTTSASVMGEGLYWGFAPSFNKLGRGFVEYELATSQDAEYYKSEEAQALITPLYEVSADNYNNKLPLDMINWYSTLVMPLKNSTKEDITLKQIVLEVATGNPLQVKGLIDTEAIGTNGFIMAYGEDGWAPMKNLNPDTEEDDLYEYEAGKKNEMLDDMRKVYLTTTNDDSKTSNTIVLNLDEVVLEAGATETFYMLVPASNGKISCNITIVAEEGVVEINQATKSNALKNTNIYHNGKKYAFGQDAKGAAKAFDITAGKFEDMEGLYYVTSYDDMMNLISSVNGTFLAYNVGDWAMDADMAEAIEESDAYVVFMNDIEIEGAALTAEDALELTKVAFNAAAIVKEDTKVEFASEVGEYDVEDKVTDIEAIVEGAVVTKLVVAEGAEVTLTSGTFKTIENAGTLTVGANAVMTEAEIETEGVLNLKDNDSAKSINLLAGTLNYKTAKTGVNVWNANKANYLTIGTLTGNAEIKVDANVVWTADLKASSWKVDNENGTVKFGVSLTNNGTIELVANDANSDMQIYGTFTNNGKIVKGGTLKLYGTSANAADAVIEVVQFFNYGTLTNNGDLLAESSANFGNNNYGTITTGARSKTYIDKTADTEANKDGKVGRIDNSAKAKVVNDASNVVFFLYDDVTATELAAEDFATYGVNTLRVTGSLTMDVAFSDLEDEDIKDAAGLGALTTLELADDAEVEVKTNVKAESYFQKVVLEGDATIFGWDKANSSLSLTNPNLVLEVWEKVATSSTAAGNVLKIEDIVVEADNLTVVTVNKRTAATQYSIDTKVKMNNATFKTYKDGDALADTEN